MVTVKELATLKRISQIDLERFGLRNLKDGVEIPYRHPDGRAARSRIRTAMRGVDGTIWKDTPDKEITAYIPPADVKTDPQGELVIVEGESDCWVCWTNCINAIGLPGADEIAVIAKPHVDQIHTVFIQRENVQGENQTFKKGVNQYVSDITGRLRKIGFSGDIRILNVPNNFQDIGDMYLENPAEFRQRIDHSKRLAGVAIEK